MNDSSKSGGSSMGLIDSFTMKGTSGDNIFALGLSGMKNYEVNGTNEDEKPVEVDGEGEGDVTQPSFRVGNEDLDELDADFSDFEDSDGEQNDIADDDREVGACSAATGTTASEDAPYLTATSKFSTSINSGPSQSSTPTPINNSPPSTQIDNPFEAFNGMGGGALAPVFDAFAPVQPHSVFNFSAQEIDVQKHLQSLFDAQDFPENDDVDNEDMVNEAEKENEVEHRFIQDDEMNVNVTQANTSTWTVSDQPSRVEKPSWISPHQPAQLSKSALFVAASQPLGNLSNPDSEGPSLGMGSQFGRYASRKSPDVSFVSSNEKIPVLIDDIGSDDEGDDASISSVPTRTSSAGRCISTPLPSHSGHSQLYKLPVFSCVSEVGEVSNMFACGSPGMSHLAGGPCDSTANPLVSVTAIQKFISGGPNASRLIDLLSKTNAQLSKNVSKCTTNQPHEMIVSKNGHAQTNKPTTKDTISQKLVYNEKDKENGGGSDETQNRTTETETRLNTNGRMHNSLSRDCEELISIGKPSIPLNALAQQSNIVNSITSDPKQMLTGHVNTVPNKETGENGKRHLVGDRTGEAFASSPSVPFELRRTQSANDTSAIPFESTLKDQISCMSMSNMSICTETIKLECNRSIVLFGCIQPGHTVSQTLQIKNTSKKCIMKIVCNVSLDDRSYQVYVSGLSPPPQIILYPSEIKTIEIIFRPTDVKMYSDSLVFNVCSTNQKYKVPLLGYGGCADLYLPYMESETRRETGIEPGCSKSVRLTNRGSRDAFLVCRPAEHNSNISFPSRAKIIRAGLSADLEIKAADNFRGTSIIVAWGDELLRRRLKRLAKQMGNVNKWHAYTSDFDNIESREDIKTGDPPVKSGESRVFFGALRTFKISLIPAYSSHSKFAKPSNISRSPVRSVLAPVNHPATQNKQPLSKKRGVEVIQDLGRVTCSSSRLVFSKTSSGAWDSVKVEFRNVSRVSKQLEFRILSGPFTLRKFKDRLLEPMKFIRIPVYFEPKVIGNVEGTLCVSVDGDAQIITIPLIGEAI